MLTFLFRPIRRRNILCSVILVILIHTVSFRVPDDLKDRMAEHDEVNWSAVLRHHLEAELADRSERNLAHAVATSERLSGDIDPEAVAEENSAEVIRSFRDRRYGQESA